MKRFVGIDLGTTNSVICTYDGRETRVWKSPEMNDVTPSAIYEDKRGNRFYGRRAYDMAPTNEKNAVTLFKRYMGTNMVFSLRDQQITPEECSAEILKVLFGYLPPEIANDEETATIITVPAAFNQMKKDATLEAARLAGIGRVTLMQEPVAAVMSVMKKEQGDKIFLIYDLGGGTFDISVAESIGGRVNLLAQGGKEMCGGRDWDRMICRKIAVPWLLSHFNLPENFMTDPTYRMLSKLLVYACEQAKIELSSMESTSIRMDEYRLNTRDLDGEEIYLDIPLTTEDVNGLIESMLMDTVEITRDTIKKVGLTPDRVSQIVFVGGPTKYKPLRDRVSAELGIAPGVDVDQMTAVAEGASIFAESIDWGTVQHRRKASREEMTALPTVRIRYEKRTSSATSRIAFLTGDTEGMTLEISSMDSGWTSGRAQLKKNLVLSVPLNMAGENRFRLEVWDASGHAVEIETPEIVITRTMATIGAIPASSPIAIKALDRIGGKAVPIYLVEENDTLPKSGKVSFYAGRVLHAGSSEALVFTLWEGGIREPIEDNRYIGTYRIPGKALAEGSIPTGAEIICEYEMSDSGALHLGVSIPSLGVNLNSMNFYSRQDGQITLNDASHLLSQLHSVEHRVNELRDRLPNAVEINALYTRLQDIIHQVENTEDPEELQQANNDLLDCLRVLARVRKKNEREVRRIDLDNIRNRFSAFASQATASEKSAFESLYATGKRAIERDGTDYESCKAEMEIYVSMLLWRQDDVIKLNVMNRINRPGSFTNRAKFDQLRARALADMQSNNYQDLRTVLGELIQIEKPDHSGAEQMLEDVNIIRK